MDLILSLTMDLRSHPDNGQSETLSLLQTPQGRGYRNHYPHFVDRETEAQVGQVKSQKVTELGTGLLARIHRMLCVDPALAWVVFFDPVSGGGM